MYNIFGSSNKEPTREQSEGKPPKPEDFKGSYVIGATTEYHVSTMAYQTNETLKQITPVVRQLTPIVSQLPASIEQLNKTLTGLDETTKKINSIVDNPTEFAQKLAQGIVSGIFNPTQPPAIPNSNGQQLPIQAPNGTDAASMFKNLMANFLESLKTAIKSGVSAATAATSQSILEKIIDIATVKDLDQNDRNILKECSDILKKPDEFVKREIEEYKQQNQNQDPPQDHDLKAQNSLQYAVNHVWKRLNQYHVIVAGVNVNQIPFRATDLNHDSNNGVSPISSMNSFKSALEKFCGDWKLIDIAPESTDVVPLPTTPQVTPNDPKTKLKPINGEISKEGLVQQKSDIHDETKEAMHRLADKTIQYSTMLCVDYIFGPTPENNKQYEAAKGDYKKIMATHSTPEAARKAFAQRYKGIGYYLIQIPYVIIYNLIAPIINDTTNALVEDIRKVLSNEIDLLDVTGKKLKEISNYLGSIETARHKYLKRDHQSGTLDNFLEGQVRNYGNKFTEKELFEHLENYLVKNYVKRPNLSIGRFRLPLLTSIVESIVWGIQKKMLLSYLRRSQVLQNLLVQGTNSVKYGQLGLKTFLKDKLQQIVDSLSQQSKSGHSYTPNNGQSDPTTQKVKLITSELKETVRVFSNKALRFIDIEACQNDDKQLQNLDSKVVDLANEIFSAFNISFFSTQKPLEDAATNMIIMSLEALMSTKENRGMEQLKTIMDNLMKSYDAPPEDEEAQKRVETKYLEDLSTVDEQLKHLTKRLSEIAVDNALAENVRNFSENKHESVKKFVEDTKNSITQLDNTLKAISETIKQDHEEEAVESRFEATKNNLSKFTSILNRFINKAIANISKAQEDCYGDVAGDYCNLFHTIVDEQHLQELQVQLNGIAENNMRLKLIEDLEKELTTLNKEITSISAIKTVGDLEQLKNRVLERLPKIIDQHIFSEDSAEQQKLEITQCFDAIIKEKKLNEKRNARLKSLDEIANKFSEFESDFELFTKSANALQLFLEIKEDIVKLKALPRKNTKDHANVDQERIQMVKSINAKITALKEAISTDQTSSLKDLKELFLIQEVNEQWLLSFLKTNQWDLHQIACKKTLELSRNRAGNFIREIQNLNGEITTSMTSSNPIKEEENELKSLNDFLPVLKSEITAILDLINFSKSAKRDQIDFPLQIKSLQEEINRYIETSNSEINQGKQKLLNLCDNISIDKEDTKKEAKQTIVSNCEYLTKILKDVRELSKHFNVRGYISIGQTHLQQFLEPPVRKKLGEVISSKISTLVAALGKKYHYKQLALETIILPVAMSETEGVS